MSWEDTPSEIISQAFVLALPSSSGSRANLLNIRQYQVLLGSICARWRKVSHEVPVLWATHLILGQFTEEIVEAIDDEHPSIIALKKQEFAEEMLSRCVDRSGSGDLTVSVHYRPSKPTLSGTQQDPGRRATELSAKSMSLLVEMLPRIHDLYMDLPSPSPFINTFFPIIDAPRLRRFRFRQLGPAELASSLFTDQSSVPLEELGMDIFGLRRITLPYHLVPHLRRLNVATVLGVPPIIFKPHIAQPSVSTNRAPMITTAEAALSEYVQLEHVHLSKVDQMFLEILWPSSVKTLHIGVGMFEPANFHPTISATLVHLSLEVNNFRGRPLDEPSRWSTAMDLPVLTSLRTLSVRQGRWVDHGKNIDIQNWLLRRAPNLRVLDTYESFAKHIVDQCADSEFTFAASESWFSSLLLWRIIFQLRLVEVYPPTEEPPRRVMAEDRIAYWRTFSERLEGQNGPRIQWGVSPGDSDPVVWFGHEVPKACYDPAASFTSLLHSNTEPSLEEIYETLCRSSE